MSPQTKPVDLPLGCHRLARLLKSWFEGGELPPAPHPWPNVEPCLGGRNELLVCVGAVNDDDDEDGACQWSEWSEWTECTVTCGRGFIMRHRTSQSACHKSLNIQQKPCHTRTVCFMRQSLSVNSSCQNSLNIRL